MAAIGSVAGPVGAIAIAAGAANAEAPCRVCQAPSPRVFTLTLLGRDVNYFDCKRCGYLQTQTPDWLDEAYEQAINDVDTGILERNRLNVGRVLMTLFVLGRLDGQVVDHAGGYGILVRALRDAGVDARWRDKYCDNLLARGFEDDDRKCDLVTAFEVFEHVLDPVVELRTLLARAPVVLLSTELISGGETPRSNWWYLGPEHGQHIGFFRTGTLRWMAEAVGCHHASDGASVHLFSREPVPRLWRAAIRRHRLWPIIARCRLKSRTWSDFEELRRRRA
jgi:hypothetical protein